MSELKRVIDESPFNKAPVGSTVGDNINELVNRVRDALANNEIADSVNHVVAGAIIDGFRAGELAALKIVDIHIDDNKDYESFKTNLVKYIDANNKHIVESK